MARRNKPFASGDFVEAAGKTGIVKAVGLFYTQLDTLDNVAVSIPNGDVTASSIHNYSREPLRRVDRTFTASYECPTEEVKAAILSAVAKDERILSDPAPFVRLLEYKGSKDVLAVKAFAEDKAGRELRLEGRKAGMLATVATLAPLLGLFGTVLGLLEAFGTVAAMGEMGDASVLADSIGKALVTTVAGLAVAMPALFVHQLLRNRLSLYSVVLEEEIATIVNRVFAAKR